MEIAYHTFKPFEDQGVATMMVSELIKIAQTADPDVEVFAQTAAQANASNATLRKVGFEFRGENFRTPKWGGFGSGGCRR